MVDPTFIDTVNFLDKNKKKNYSSFVACDIEILTYFNGESGRFWMSEEDHLV